MPPLSPTFRRELTKRSSDANELNTSTPPHLDNAYVPARHLTGFGFGVPIGSANLWAQRTFGRP